MSETPKITYQIAQTHVLQAVINYLETKPYNEVTALLQTLVNTTKQFTDENVIVVQNELADYKQEPESSPSQDVWGDDGPPF